MGLPKQGKSETELFELLETFREGDMPWRDGRTWAYVYDPGPEAEAVIKRAFSLYLQENGLDPTVFPSAMHLENEVVGVAVELLHGGEQVVGSFTSGGTESILCAVKAARDFARAERPGSDGARTAAARDGACVVPEGGALPGAHAGDGAGRSRRPSAPIPRRCARRSRPTP